MTPFTALDRYLPELAESETRSVVIEGRPELPDDTYTFKEAFCADPKCDCHRAYIYVASAREDRIVATLGYGWKSRSFYREEFGGDDAALDELVGVKLAPGSVQSPMSQPLADLFDTLLDDEPEYRERIEKHYARFKEALQEREEDRGDSDDLGPSTPDECLESLGTYGIYPVGAWLEPGPEGCDSAWTLLGRHGAHLEKEERLEALPALQTLWEHWSPDRPCVETLYHRALGHLDDALRAETRPALEKAWAAWLADGVGFLVDDQGHLRGDLVKTLDEAEGRVDPSGVVETLLCSAIHMLTPPMFEPALERMMAIDLSGQARGRCFEVLQGMLLVNRGDIPGAMKLFDRLARQEPRSLAVHLGAGCALLAVAGKDARLLRQAQWYLARAHQRVEEAGDYESSLVLAALEDLDARTGKGPATGR